MDNFLLSVIYPLQKDIPHLLPLLPLPHHSILSLCLQCFIACLCLQCHIMSDYSDTHHTSHIKACFINPLSFFCLCVSAGGHMGKLPCVVSCIWTHKFFQKIDSIPCLIMSDMAHDTGDFKTKKESP